jgi:hypothetical protein
VIGEPQGVTQWIQFEYPNRRSHERAVEVDRELGVGDEVTLFGHRWRVKHLLGPDRRNTPKLVCTRADAEPPP